jgi:hypothetical protein
MVEQPYTEYQIESSPPLYGLVLDVGLVEYDLRIAASCFLYVLFPAICPNDFESQFPQEYRQVADAAANVEGRTHP